MESDLFSNLNVFLIPWHSSAECMCTLNMAEFMIQCTEMCLEKKVQQGLVPEADWQPAQNNTAARNWRGEEDVLPCSTGFLSAILDHEWFSLTFLCTGKVTVIKGFRENKAVTQIRPFTGWLIAYYTPKNHLVVCTCLKFSAAPWHTEPHL